MSKGKERKKREELVLGTLPELDMNEIDGTELTDGVAQAVQIAEESSLARTRRERLKQELSSPEQDMAPDVPLNCLEPTSGAVVCRDFGRVESDRLLRSLGITTSAQLSRNDTYNLLACLMSSGEGDIDILLKNPKLPIAVKIILRRLKEDLKTGDTELTERLWDRLFGKGPLQSDLPSTGVVETGIFPGHPISREAYAIIMKKIT